MSICPCCKTSHDSTACPTPSGKGLDAMPCSVPWDGYALEEVEKHAHALKVKCIEITKRCALPSVTDYTVKMAIREMAQNDH